MPAADEDFLSSMFSQEQPAGSMPNTEDFYGSQPAFSNPQNTQEMMENMMALHPPAARQTLLESQLKIQQLQQLQQLQQQIFQQQMELLGGSMPNSTFHGLPTPASSTELRAQPNTEYVSPMMLQQAMSSYSGAPSYVSQSASPRFSQHLSNSAPANIAFHMSPLPTDMDFDVSPLTSPWLEAYPQPPVASSSNSNKRTASPSDDESSEKPSRKRRPTATIAKKSIRGSKSANSTPATRPSNPEVTGDTPSPVDLSMPPPAHPGLESSSNGMFNSTIAPVSTEERLIPVTPASIMNLGRLGVNSSLVPPNKPKPGTGKEKSTPKLKRTPVASPSLKPILPADGAFATPTAPQPLLHGKKPTHKDAEQKRRDALKTSFDDLRSLLPPIPSPSDETEPLLPGAMPPRGPPRPGGGPNVNVSKLQLLRCGNDYLRVLKGRIERRDTELERLRRRLREVVSDDGELDLPRDLDLVEKCYTSEIMEADEAEDG